MNERIKELYEQAMEQHVSNNMAWEELNPEKFAELLVEDMHRKVIASILITDVVMEEKGLTPTSEDYIHAINKDFGVEE